MSPADEQGKAPSFSRDEPNRSLVVVGRTQEGFWADLRGNYPLTSEQLAQRYYNSEFTVREALDAITRIARERQLSERMPAGWERPSTLRGTAATLIQVQKLAVPILNEPTLVSENLVVRALAKQGEFYPVLESYVAPAKLGPPLQVKPYMSGTRWARVRMRNDGDGWIYIDGTNEGSPVAAVIYRFPAQPPESRPVSAQTDLPVKDIPSIAVVAVVIGLLALSAFGMKKRTTESAGYTGSSSDPGSSSYCSADHNSEVSYAGTSDDSDEDDERAESPTDDAVVHFSIRVVYYDDGTERTLTCTEVHVEINQDCGFLPCWSGRWEDTDNDGVAHFEFQCVMGFPSSKKLWLKVYVDSVDGDEYTIEDGEDYKEITVCVDRD